VDATPHPPQSVLDAPWLSTKIVRVQGHGGARARNRQDASEINVMFPGELFEAVAVATGLVGAAEIVRSSAKATLATLAIRRPYVRVLRFKG